MNSDPYDAPDKEFIEKTGKPIKEWKKILKKWDMKKKGFEKSVSMLRKEYELKTKWARAICIRYQKDKYM